MVGVLVLIVLYGALMLGTYNLSLIVEDSDFQLRRPIPADQLPPDESAEAVDSFFLLQTKRLQRDWFCSVLLGWLLVSGFFWGCWLAQLTAS
jgi:hypothetical protein